MVDHTLRESLRLVGEYLEKGSLSTVCFVSNDLLMKAKDDEELKNAIEGMDLSIASTTQILEAGGIRSVSRIREVEGDYFLRELLKRLAREKKKIFLLGNTQEELVALREQFLSVAGKLTFFGSFALDGPETSEDTIVNAINVIIPDVIISSVDSPRQEMLMASSRSMVNARLWVSLQPEVREALTKGGKSGGFLGSVIDRLIFKRTVKRYDDNG